MKINLEQRLLDFLENRGISGDIQDFLFPKISMLLNPYDLNGMDKAVSKIRQAIADKKQILIFGDYDCDGISASCILMMYLKSKGANVSAFIPSRFEDGYGLNMDTIDELCKSNKPDLIITVDLGITAITEVEELKKRGIDIIVTDHHEPMQTLPNCIVIDAKVANQKYAFDGLCGAGVALKLVEAMESRKYIEQFLDICAIATIGDIVPLVNENRVIAKLGLEKINSDNCLPSIKFLKNKLGLSDLTSEDVSFKIVPRLNASGRMDNGKKVLDFLIESDEQKLEELYLLLEEDNNKRLSEIAQGNEEIYKQLTNIDLKSNFAILSVGDFHQGVLGILASRVCHEYNRPAIIFTKTPEGTYKGSGRSIGSINIHSILCNMSDLFVRFGGHKMAVGLEILPEKFEEFKNRFNSEIQRCTTFEDFKISNFYDIEITEEDISLKFINQLRLLEPFGCANEKPVFMMKTNSLVCEQMKGKNYKHYRLHTKSGKQIIAFNAYKYIEMLKNNCAKQLFVDLELNVFNGKKYANCKLKDAIYDDKNFSFNAKMVTASSIVNKYLSHNSACGLQNCMHLSESKLLQKAEELAENAFGTLIVCQNNRHLEKLLSSDIIAKNYIISCVAPNNKQNCILIRSAGIQAPIAGYSNYIFMRSAIKNEHRYFDENCSVFDQNLFMAQPIIETDRNVMGICYNLIKKNCANIFSNDIFEWAEKISAYDKRISPAQVLFACFVFADLNLVHISGMVDPTISIIDNGKCELHNSKFYNEF